MERLFHLFSRLLRDDDFRRFQCDVADSAYEQLSRGYLANEDEVALVGRLVKATNGKHFGPLIHIHADKIHGGRSYVEFKHQDKPVTKELGDLAVIAIVTHGDDVLLQRVCIIQNKKRSGKTWGLDLEQLYLLKNFPPFSGSQGLFAGQKNVIFRNHSGCLGAYGLLEEPGEMLFASAPLVAELRQGKQSITHADISVPQDCYASSGTSPWGAGMYPFAFHPEGIFIMEKLMHRYGMLFPFGHGSNFPFLGNSIFLRDLHDFARGWTQLNIGEVTFAFGEMLNPAVDSFARLLIHAAGIRLPFDLPPAQQFANMDRPFDQEFGVIVAHIDVGKEG